MTAFEFGIVGCTSSSVVGEERLGHSIMRMKSLSSSAVVWQSAASISCGLKVFVRMGVCRVSRADVFAKVDD